VNLFLFVTLSASKGLLSFHEILVLQASKPGPLSTSDAQHADQHAHRKHQIRTGVLQITASGAAMTLPINSLSTTRQWVGQWSAKSNGPTKLQNSLALTELIE
jgi:hypothetical protein